MHLDRTEGPSPLRAAARRLVARPSAATPAGTARLVQVLCCAGALLALVLSGLPGQAPALVAALETAALVAGGLALVARCRETLQGTGLHVVLVVGSLVVSASALAAGDPLTATALTLGLGVVVVVAVAVCSWLGVALHAAVAVASAVGLHLAGGVGTPTTVLVVSAGVVVTALVAGRAVHTVADAQVDGLTGLPTRRAFEQRVSSALASAQTTANDGEQAPLVSVLLMDLDHFDRVNRSRGQSGGDDVLRSVARRLTAALPSGTSCARLDGDRFAVLLEHRDAELVPDVVAALQRAITPLEASFGAAEAEAEEDGSTLVRRADLALHAAKSAGRNCLRVAESHDEQLVRGLRKALVGPSVQVALQPLVDPTSRQLVGVEALARWNDPSRGWVSPGVFIPVAEKSGLIPDLGRVVMERACRDALVLVQHLGRPVVLTVNASGAELVRPEYVAQVVEVLHRTQWPAHDLVIEVTESNLDAASQETLATVEQLRQLGVRVAIDDFGTGYSAFSQLDHIPAEFLKLDTSFTATLATSARRRSMLSALVTLCRDLDMRVIAEGVETGEQAELVARFGCDLAQGYHYARPMAVADLITDLELKGVAAARHGAVLPNPRPGASR